MKRLTHHHPAGVWQHTSTVSPTSGLLLCWKGDKEQRNYVRSSDLPSVKIGSFHFPVPSLCGSSQYVVHQRDPVMTAFSHGLWREMLQGRIVHFRLPKFKPSSLELMSGSTPTLWSHFFLQSLSTSPRRSELREAAQCPVCSQPSFMSTCYVASIC